MDILSGVHWAQLSGLAASLIVLTVAVNVAYNLFFHPLARFPGPLLWRATRLPYVTRLVRGQLPKRVLDLHLKYGPIVRLAPGELSFASPDAWRDIYGHRTGDLQGKDEMSKDPLFYSQPGQKPSVIAETRDRHAVIRRQLAHGFSDKSLRGQESIIGGYVDQLIEGLRTHSIEGGRPKALDMTSWYNWTTFDVIGDLAFGEPFGCLDKAEYHPWVAAVNNALRLNPRLLALKQMGLGWLADRVIKFAFKARRFHLKSTDQKLQRRIELDVERPDLIEGLLRKKDSLHLDFSSLSANASLLIIAGSETTATLLSGVTYLLLRNPDKLKRLVEEVRSSFQSEDEITLLSVGKLSYMLACLDEGMRRYPPVPFGMPRQVPQGGAMITGEQVAENTTVAVWQWATYHNPQHWKDPFGFHPERFLHDPAFAGDKLDALQPFSVGPRNCLGRNLAYSEMRLILARILFNFDMRLADEDFDWMDQEMYVLWYKHPLNVFLTPVARGPNVKV